MADPIFLIRGSFDDPFRFGPTEGMINDFREVGALSEDQISRLTEILNHADDFIDFKKLRVVVEKIISSPSSVDGVTRILWNIEQDDLQSFFRRLDSWREQDSNAKTFSDEDFNQSKTNLKKLVKPFPALDRYRKAQRLVKATGQPLEDIQVICDLRPVFNEKREYIEGLIPITTLRIEVEGADGFSKVMEAGLTAQQVVELADKATLAKKKLESLIKYVNQSDAKGMPDLPSTRFKKGE